MSELISTSIIPLYRQLADRIQNDIVNTTNDLSLPIPSEQELMKMYSVSRVTVRKAVEELVKEGILSKIHGKGTFITKSHSFYPLGHGEGFTRSCIIRGVTPSTFLLKCDVVAASEEDRAFFNIDEDEPVFMIQRLRCGDDEPCILETLYFPRSYEFLRNDNLEESLYGLLKEKYHIFPQKGHKWIEIHHASAEEAQIMNSQANTAMILMHESITDQKGMPLHTSMLIFSSSFRFYM